MDKKFLGVICLLLIASQTALSYDNNVYTAYKNSSEIAEQTNSEYYQNGIKYISNKEYSQAIDEFKRALRENPQNLNARLQLVSAYTLNAQYNHDKTSDYNKSANDLRNAIFYLKYYTNTPLDAKYINNLHIMENNLDNILYAIKADQTTKGRYMMGKSLRAQGEFAAAAVEFHKALGDENYKKDSLKNLGEIYYTLNIPEMAVNYLSQAINYDVQNAELHKKLGDSYDRLGQIENAAAEYNLALGYTNDNDILDSLEDIWKQKSALSPNDAEAHANLGAVYQRKNKFDAAMSEYEKAESLNPSNITTRLNLGTLYQTKKEYETAIEAYDTILKVNPNYTRAYWYKAQCYRALGIKEAAVQNYKLALALDPYNKNIKDELAEVLEENMTPEEKLKYLCEQATKNPQNADFNYKYAYELHKVGKLEEAVSYYEATLKLDTKNEDAYINLAQALQQQGNYDKAKSVLSKAKSIFPDNLTLKKQLDSIDAQASSVLYSQGSDLFRQKKYNEAIAVYEKIKPATPEALVGIGASYQSLGNNAKAADCYVKSFELDPINSQTAYYAALAYSNLENFAKAKEYAKKAIAINAQNKNAKELLTYVIEQENTEKVDKALELYESQKYDEAMNLLSDVIAQDPHDANAYYYRGMVCDAQKKYTQAIEDYKKALANNSQMNIAYYSIAIDYDYLAQYANALTYHKKYVAETQKAGETNDYTRYSTKRIQDLKAYEPKTTASKN